MFFLAAAHWAGRCAERHVAWPWRRRRSIFSVSYCVGRTLNSVNVCSQYPVFNALGAAMCHPQSLARRWAGGRTKRRVVWPWQRRRSFSFCVVLCWQNVKICECLLAMPSFQCIGGGSVPPPMPCRTLGQAARQKARRLALAEALILFFLSYCVGKALKSMNVCLQCPVFNALGVAVCRPRCLAGC